MSNSEKPDFDLAYARQVIASEAEAVKAIIPIIDRAFLNALEMLYNCTGSVIVSGIGKAGIIGQKISATLASTGTPSHFLHPAEAVHGDLGRLRANDVVLVLSYGGETDEITRLINLVKQRQIKLIAITGESDSTLAKHSDVVLCMGKQSEACPLGIAPSVSTTCMLALGDALALTVMELKSVKPDQYASYHPGGALGRLLLKAGEIMRTGLNCPTVLPTATMGACHTAILRAPLRAGAACVVDEAGKLVGIITHGDFFRLFTSAKPISDRSVSEVMTRSPKSIGLNARVTDALHLMQKHRIDELPVVDDNDRLAGLIDIQDLIAKGFTVFDEP